MPLPYHSFEFPPKLTNRIVKIPFTSAPPFAFLLPRADGHFPVSY